MKRYALPLAILAGIIILIVLMFVGGSNAPNYGSGEAAEQPISAEWVRGNPSSTVQLIEYSDFQCPACNAYYPILKQVEAQFSDRVAFIYRHYPLYQIHPNADLAARAAEAAGVQGKFWQMHDELFDHHEAWVDLLDPTSAFVGYATEIGLNADQFKADLDSAEVKKLVADDYARGQNIGVEGTPTFVLNGVKIKNPTSVEELAAALNVALLGK